MERGMMHLLHNLIQRSSVLSDPQKNMNASKDFMLLLMHTRVAAAAEALLSINPTNIAT